MGHSAVRARGRVGGLKPKRDVNQIRKFKLLLTNPAAQVNDIAEPYRVSRTSQIKSVSVDQPVKV